MSANDDPIEILRSRGDRMLDSYFWSFEPTGDADVDLILAAVARAGKAYHSTEMWCEPMDDADGPCYWEAIQSMANRAASERVTRLEQA